MPSKLLYQTVVIAGHTANSTAAAHVCQHHIYAACAQVIDERLCKGLWNAGLLSTQAGTIGRFCGNLLLSGSAHVTGAKSAAQIANFARLMFSQDVLFMAVSLGFVGLTYPRLLG